MGAEFLAALPATADPEIRNRNSSLELLSDSEKFHVENQSRVRRDRAGRSRGSITELRRNSQLPLTADFHSSDTLVPTFDHLPGPERKYERFVAIARAVELLTARKEAGVVNLDVNSRGCRRAGADYDVPVLQAGSSGCRRAGHFHGGRSAGCARRGGRAGLVVAAASGSDAERGKQSYSQSELSSHETPFSRIGFGLSSFDSIGSKKQTG